MNNTISLTMDSISIKGDELIPEGNLSPIRIVSIIGPMRKGKSWLLNYLISSQDYFPVGGKHACTTGLKIEFINSVTEDQQNNMQYRNALAVIDVEGMGDVHANRDRDLSLLSLLLSGVILYNVQGYAPKEEILKNLEVTLRSFELLSHEDKNFGLKSSNVKFGHLNVIIRDSQHKLSKIDFEKELFEMEDESIPINLSQSYLSQNPTSSIEHILERNRIRQRLRHYYSGLHVWLLPHPTNNISDLYNDESILFENVSESFSNSVIEMRTSIQKQLSLFGNPFGLTSKEDLLELIQNVINMLQNQNLRISSLVSILEGRNAEKYINIVLNDYIKKIKEIELPCDNLFEKLELFKNQAKLRLKYVLGFSLMDSEDTLSLDLSLYNKSIEQFEKEFSSISHNIIQENIDEVNKCVNENISSLLKDALQMMNPEFEQTYHDNFDDIFFKVEDKLTNSPLFNLLPDSKQNDSIYILRKHLTVLRSVHETQGKARLQNNFTRLQQLILKYQGDLQSSLPLKQDKLLKTIDSIYEEIRNDIIVSTGTKLSNDVSLNFENMEILLENMKSSVVELNNYMIKSIVDSEIEKYKSEAERMLTLYDHQQFLQSNFMHQFECFLEEMKTKPSKLTELLDEIELKEIFTKIDFICKELYELQVNKNKSIHIDTLLQVKQHFKDCMSQIEKELYSITLPHPNEKLNTMFEEIFNNVKDKAIFILKNQFQNIISPEEYNSHELELHTQFKRICSELEAKNSLVSQKFADLYFEDKFKDLVIAFYTSNNSEAAIENLEYMFLTNETNGYKLMDLPLDLEFYKNKIRILAIETFEKIQQDKENKKLKESNNSLELLSVNKLLVEKIKEMRSELQILSELKKENEELKKKIEQYTKDYVPNQNAHQKLEYKNLSVEIQESNNKNNEDKKVEIESDHCNYCSKDLKDLDRYVSSDSLNICEECFFKHKFDTSSTIVDVYNKSTLIVKNISLLIKRIEEMGFATSQYFNSRNEIAQSLIKHHGELKILVSELLQKQKESIPVKKYEYNYEIGLLNSMGFTNEELNKKLLERYRGDVQRVADYLSK